jgi:hypothetical protein
VAYFQRDAQQIAAVARTMPSFSFLREPVASWPRRPDVLQSMFSYLSADCDPTGVPVPAVFWTPTAAFTGNSTCVTTPGSRWARLLPSITGFDVLGSRRVDIEPLVSFVVGAFGVGLDGVLTANQANSYRALDTSLGRRYPAATLDMRRDEVVLFGGEALDGGVLGDTWRLPHRGQMTLASVSGSSPSARRHAAMAYHPGLGKTVLHGGNDGTRTLSDTWLWDGAQWEKLAQTQPLPREQHEMVYGAGTLWISGGLNDGGPSAPMARLIENEWSTQPIQRFEIPAHCSYTGPARAYVTPAGLSSVCPAPDGGFLLQPTGGAPTLRMPNLPFAGPGPNFFFNFRLESTRRFGFVAAMSDMLESFPPADLKILSQGNWVVGRNTMGRPFVGACFVWRGEFACNDGTTVMLSNDAVVSLPSTTRRVTGAHVWPQSDTAWVVDRTTDDNRTARFEIRSDGTLRVLPGTFPTLSAVAYAGAPAGELFVLLRRIDNRDTIDVETFDGVNWVTRNVAPRAQLFALPQALEPQPGRFFTFNGGQLFGDSNALAPVAPLRLELLARGIRPTLQTSLPALPTRCDRLTLVEVEAIGQGSAGGTPGFGIHQWDGFGFHPTPAITSSPSMTRAKSTHPNPAASFRFGTTINPVFDPNQFKSQPVQVRFSTQGASRGALDGELRIDAFQTRYSCRLNP